MAKRLGEYIILKRHGRIHVQEQVAIGETVGYKLADTTVLSDFRGAKLELDRNFEYSFEGNDFATLRMRGLDSTDTFNIMHRDWNWREIKIVDLCIRRNLVLLLLVQGQRSNTLSLYILTLNGELVTENRTEFGNKSASLELDKARFVIDAQSTAVNLLIETSYFRGSNQMYRVNATPGISLISMEEREWNECQCFKGNFCTFGQRPNIYGEAMLRGDELFYLPLESKVPRLLFLYNIKSQTNSEIVLQTPRGPRLSEENLLSSTCCIDHKHNKILVPYTKLQSFFSHQLLLRVFSMSGLMEREIVIWECERCPELGLPAEFPLQSIATWCWPMEPISSALTEDGRLWITWFSGPNSSGQVLATLSRLNYL